MYKHWKKLLLALTAFFWNACDNGSSPSAPVNNPDTSSSATNGVSSSDAASSSSNAVESSSSSSENASSSSVESSSSEVRSSSSDAVSSSSSLDVLPMPLYGVFVDNICTKAEGDSTLACSDGVKCIESLGDTELAPRRDTPEVAAKYGIVYVRNKTYKCDDGKVYNEAEFRELYEIITSIPEKKISCYQRGESIDCDDGQSFSIDKDEKGNKTYVNESAVMTEEEFWNKYEIFEQHAVLYGPPCVFNGTCDEEK